MADTRLEGHTTTDGYADIWPSVHTALWARPRTLSFCNTDGSFVEARVDPYAPFGVRVLAFSMFFFFLAREDVVYTYAWVDACGDALLGFFWATSA